MSEVYIHYESLFRRFNEPDFRDLYLPSELRVLSKLTDTNEASEIQLRKLLLSEDLYSFFINSPEKCRILIDTLSLNEARELSFEYAQHEDEWQTLKHGILSKKGRHRFLTSIGIEKQIVEEEAKERTDQALISPQYALFPHQKQAITELESLFFDENTPRALLHMPTGSGKTRSAMNLIATFMRNHRGKYCLWIANRDELLDQAFEEFQRAWSFLGDRQLPILRYGNLSNESLLSHGEGVIVASIQTLQMRYNKDHQSIREIARELGLTIFDEAHQVTAPTYSMLVEGLCGFAPQMKFLGLSATPGRTYNDPEKDAELSDFFDRKKVTLTVDGFSNPVEYLVSEGYLAQTHFETINFETVFQESIEHGEFKITDQMLKALELNEKRTFGIVKKIRELSENHNRIIVFATTVDHSNLLSRALNFTHLESRSITSKGDSASRQLAIEWFKERTPDCRILCNFGVLTTGFDAPQTSCAVIARPVESLVLYSQMVGRAMRGILAGGNSDCHILTVTDTSLPAFGDMAQAFENWEDVW